VCGWTKDEFLLDVKVICWAASFLIFFFFLIIFPFRLSENISLRIRSLHLFLSGILTNNEYGFDDDDDDDENFPSLFFLKVVVVVVVVVVVCCCCRSRVVVPWVVIWLC